MVTAAVLAAVLSLQTGAQAAPAPGSPGAGDVYYPDYGNGGYDVAHYDIRLRYYPDTDRLTGTTTILATATRTFPRSTWTSCSTPSRCGSTTVPPGLRARATTNWSSRRPGRCRRVNR